MTTFAAPLPAGRLDDAAADALNLVEYDDDALCGAIIETLIGLGYSPDPPDHLYSPPPAEAWRDDRPGYTAAAWELSGSGIGRIWHLDRAGRILVRAEVRNLRYPHGFRLFANACAVRP